MTEPLERIAHGDAFFAATRADIRHGGGQAYYSGASDHVPMPCFESLLMECPPFDRTCRLV
ncbi:zincin-like metallopeptidase domain-containing protein [Ciceribacter sp. T2.26MG-112.2]|uniref:zincin-like metallopeptidase domain-containing protein n=1 Tax=Ciceribacter sp. T2.26MG-112.2 TaxID=3137154 RepID=UPI001E4AA081|nr:zincin-like metallopeptidase domain-containing protein [Ciceribacter naphthalenivorans]